MKEIKSTNRKVPGYEIQNVDINTLVAASIYKEIPDRDKLVEELTQGIMIQPLVVYEAPLKYWQVNHSRLYKANHPDLPWDNPPIVHDKVNIVWFGRQRLALLKELGYTHVDVIKAPTLQETVRVGHSLAN